MHYACDSIDGRWWLQIRRDVVVVVDLEQGSLVANLIRDLSILSFIRANQVGEGLACFQDYNALAMDEQLLRKTYVTCSKTTLNEDTDCTVNLGMAEICDANVLGYVSQHKV